MTVLDKLLAEGLTCPCGGDVELDEILDTRVYYRCQCGFCDATIDNGWPTKADAVAAWLVLTGGPIPGSVPPPGSDWYEISGDRKGNSAWYEIGRGWDKDVIEAYALNLYQRILDTITEWLQTRTEDV